MLLVAPCMYVAAHALLMLVVALCLLPRLVSVGMGMELNGMEWNVLGWMLYSNFICIVVFVEQCVYTSVSMAKCVYQWRTLYY